MQSRSSTATWRSRGDFALHHGRRSLGVPVEQLADRRQCHPVGAATSFRTASIRRPAIRARSSPTPSTITTGGNFIADANIDTVNDLVITVPGSIQFDRAISDGSIDLWAQDGSINIEGVDAGAALDLLAATWSIPTTFSRDRPCRSWRKATGSTSAISLAGGDVSLLAGTFIEGDDVITNGNIFAQTLGGDMQFANLSGADVTLDSIGSIFFGEIAGFVVDLNAGGLISGGNVDSVTDITAVAGSRIDLGDLEAGGFDDIEAFPRRIGPSDCGHGHRYRRRSTPRGFVELFAGGDIGTDTPTSWPTDYIDIFTFGGAIALGDLDAGTISTLRPAAPSPSATSSPSSFDFDAGGSVTGGNIVVSEVATGQADGTVTLGNISAGIGNPELPSRRRLLGRHRRHGLDHARAMSTGAHAVGFATLGPLITGDLERGRRCHGAGRRRHDLGLDHDRRRRPGLSRRRVDVHRCRRARRFRPAHWCSRSIRSRPAGRSPSAGRFRPASSRRLQGPDSQRRPDYRARHPRQAPAGRPRSAAFGAPDRCDLASNDINIRATGGIDAGRPVRSPCSRPTPPKR